METQIKYNTHNRIASITLARPEKRNALNAGLISGLTEAFRKAEADEEIRVVVLKAEGDVFSAGADLAYLQQLQNNTHQENITDTSKLRDLFHTVHTLSKITIAQVEGHAIAGGCGLATVCDIVFAVPEAKFGYTEVKIGFIPALVAAFLLNKIGEGRAKEMLLSGNLIDAQTASSYGLINFVVEKAEIADNVNLYAESLCKTTSASSVKLTKQLLQQIQSLPLNPALDNAVQANADARATADFKKGIAGFLNGEKLEW